MWDLIVSVPDHCLSFYFVSHLTEEAWLTVPNLFCESSSFGCFFKFSFSSFNNSIVIFKFQKQYFISDFQTMSHDKPKI